MSRSMFISDTFPWHVTAHFLLSYTDKHKMRQNATLQFERSRFVIQHNTFNTKVDTPTSFIFPKHLFETYNLWSCPKIYELFSWCNGQDVPLLNPKRNEKCILLSLCMRNGTRRNLWSVKGIIISKLWVCMCSCLWMTLCVMQK